VQGVFVARIAAVQQHQVAFAEAGCVGAAGQAGNALVESEHLQALNRPAFGNALRERPRELAVKRQPLSLGFGLDELA
jgi:hypothetical protein